MEEPPRDCEIELTLLGPGYGESILIHIGDGKWVIVDSFPDSDERPVALGYLEEIGVDPAQAVVLIVATHWHDDHIRGISQLVERCSVAEFCCASALCRKEFLTLAGALEGRHFSASGSGLRELYSVFSYLKSARRKPAYAIANRMIYQTQACSVWSLSPSDEIFQSFLQSVQSLIPGAGDGKTIIPSLSPNKAAVVLWVSFQRFSLLLGADLERRGWQLISITGCVPRVRHRYSKSLIMAQAMPTNRVYGTGCWSQRHMRFWLPGIGAAMFCQQHRIFIVFVFPLPTLTHPPGQHNKPVPVPVAQQGWWQRLCGKRMPGSIRCLLKSVLCNYGILWLPQQPGGRSHCPEMRIVSSKLQISVAERYSTD